MWLSLGLFTLVGFAIQIIGLRRLAKLFQFSKEACFLIIKDGPRICLVWARQLISSQIGKYLVEIHHQYYLVHYPYGATWYKIMIPRNRGPCMIDTITNDVFEHVKKEVIPFMGPGHNFHGSRVTPGMLGYESLTFTFINGDTRTFCKNEILIL